MNRINESMDKYGKPILLAAGVVIIILIIILIWNHHKLNQIFEYNFAGMWIAPEDFCARSGIDGMMIYIGPKLDTIHKAYMIMYSNNSIVLSRAIEIKFDMAFPKLLTNSVITKKMNLNCQDPEESLIDIMPNNQTLTLDLTQGKMEWTAWDAECNDYRLYAEFYRDNISSNSI